MKALCISIFAMTLVVASAPISAQDATQPPPPPVTQQQLRQVVKKFNARENKNARAIKRNEAQICALTATQAKQGNDIARLADQQGKDVVAINTTADNVTKLRKSDKALQVRTSHQMLWLAILTAVVVIAICGGVIFVRRTLTGQRAKETILINPDVMTLRALWEDKHSPITFTVRLNPNPDKGFLEGGDVSGYVATFDDSFRAGAVSDQFPKITYKGDVLRLDKLPKHAASVLGLKATPAPPTPGTERQFA